MGNVKLESNNGTTAEVFQVSKNVNITLTPELAKQLDGQVDRIQSQAPAGSRATRHSVARLALERGLKAMARQAAREAEASGK